MHRQQISNVQLLRFFAAMAVMLSHAAGLLIPKSSAFWAVPWVGGVDLFFVISGFVMTLISDGEFGRQGASRSFIFRRAVRILPAYWFFTTVMVGLALIAPQLVPKTSLAPDQLITSYLFIPWPRPADGLMNPILAQGWTLNYEAFFYVVFALALNVRRGLLLVVAALTTLAMAHPLIPPEWFVLEFYAYPIILEFVAGIAIGRLYLSGWRMPNWARLLCVPIAIAIFTISFEHRFGGRFVQLGIPAALIVASLVCAPEPGRPGPIRRALQAGGDASYTLYLSHLFTVNAVILIWMKLGLNAPWMGVACAGLVAIGFSLVFYRWIERPVTDALSARFGARRGDVAPPYRGSDF